MGLVVPLTGSESTLDVFTSVSVAFVARRVLVIVQEITSPICGVTVPPTVFGSAVVEPVKAFVQLIVAVYCVRLVEPEPNSVKE